MPKQTFKLTLLGSQITEPCPKSHGEPYYRVEMDNGIEKQVGIFHESGSPDIYHECFMADILNFDRIFPIDLGITMTGIVVDNN